MRKLLFCTVIIAMSMVSCLKDTNPKRLPIYGGIEMRTAVFNQNVFALDPAVVAFRLNILLSEAKKQGKSELDGVKVMVGENELFLIDILFKTNKVTKVAENDGTYSIYYNDSFEGSTPKGDVVRDGTILVQTNNKLIEELVIGESWNLYCTATDKKYRLGSEVMIKLPPKEDDVIGGTGGYYSISATDTPKQWTISSYNLVTYYDNHKNLPGVWQMDLHVTQTGSAVGMSYDEILKSGFTVTGDAGGIPTFFYNANVSYLITAPLGYKTTCSDNMVFENVFTGSEKITLKEAISIEHFPSDVATVQWRNITSCKNAHYLHYNGYLMDSATGSVVEDGARR